MIPVRGRHRNDYEQAMAEGEDARSSICLEADRLVSGDRQQDYGHPIEDFTRTGRMWGAILGLDRDVRPEEVAMCLLAVKISREVNRPKRDNRVDMAGYAKTLDLVRQRQALLRPEGSVS